MKIDKNQGWANFLKGYPWFRGDDQFRIQAYSEFMPPVRTGINPSDGSVYPWVFKEDDPFGWNVQEIEEEYQLRPGLEKIGKQILEHINKLSEGALPASLVGHHGNLAKNIFWSEELEQCMVKLKHEKYITIMPLSFSKTKDDKGRVCWTFFGASEQGPEKAFWKSFYEAPDKEVPETVFFNFMKWVFGQAYGIELKSGEHLRNLGFRILPSGDAFPFSYWRPSPLPSWTKKWLTDNPTEAGEIKYLLTFRPYGMLPPAIKQRYASEELHLIPFPGNMVMWGFRDYLRLQETLHNAIQIPMLRLVKRDEGFSGIRVPQSGWVFQPGAKGKRAKRLEEFIVENYIRTNRWDRFHRNEDGLLKSTRIDSVLETLLSTSLKTLDLYNKPMARNSQLFSESIELLLDGPTADRKKIGEAVLKIMEGGNFRYRFYFPPMQSGEYEIFWHRPLVACISRITGEPVIASELATGYFTGYHSSHPDPSETVELWPRIRKREIFLSMLKNFDPIHDHYLHQTSLNLMALIDAWEHNGEKPLERDYARSLIRIPKTETLDTWISGFTARSKDMYQAKEIMQFVRSILQPEESGTIASDSLTFNLTSTRKYEEEYWNQIFFLAHGDYVNKDNADIVQDHPTREWVGHRDRDLHRLGDYFLERYHAMIRYEDMQGSAEAGELAFRWETDFEYLNYGGWKANQEGKEYERNLLVIIPGKNRKEAVVMADHYDTAYMADVFDAASGGTGARLAAAGADDNHSASATLLLAAPIFLKMAKEGKLARDIWLLHLTGEEFPSDCMGARNFCQHVVQRTLKMRRKDGTFRDLSQVNIKGVLVMDMIAHNRDSDRDVFQIAPGKTGDSLELAHQARQACQLWNANAVIWNEQPDRKGCPRGRRTQDMRLIPPKALHLPVDGEIRTWEDPHSTLYNTDGMIFSDVGIPVILFMENYDISRRGYHDTHDTMENIDLDYGAAVSAIAIETIAKLAALKQPVT